MSSERNRRKLITIASLAIALGVLGFLAFGGIGDNLVYYWSPTELLEAGNDAYGANVRLGGLVATGSVHHGAGSELSFDVTDGTNTVAVRCNAVPPAMFREGIGVVVEGTYDRSGVFSTQRLMVKHDNEYRAPGEGEEPDLDDLVRTMQFEDAS